MAKKVKINRITCQRCGHIWAPTKEIIRVCPKCKSAWWDVKRKSKK